MIIDSNFMNILDKSNISDDFKTILKTVYEKFAEQIMIELTSFKYDQTGQSFANLDLTSREYELQKYFELRLETYIRNHLVNDFFEMVLENKGYSVYRPEYQIPEDTYVEGEIFCSNKEYEDNVGFEFIIDDGNQTIGFRYTDITPSRANHLFLHTDINSIKIIDWLNIDGLHEEEKEHRLYEVMGDVDILGLRDFLDEWLEPNESNIYELFLDSSIKKYKETLGINSSVKLSPPSLFMHRIETERLIEIKERDFKLFISIERKNRMLPLNEQKDTHYGYRIIDEKTKNSKYYNDVEVLSKECLENSDVINEFYSEKLYKVLTGKNDIAKSFLTSEYLYEQYDETDCFDYTSITSGYLKSVEQLLYNLAFMHLGEEDFKIKTKSGCKIPKSKRSDLEWIGNEKKKVQYIKFSKENIDYFDTTLGSLIFFIEYNKNKIFRIDDQYCDTILKCLRCFKNECRNDSFHLHNVYDWERVSKIQHNVFIIYVMLLGGCKISKETMSNQFNIIEKDTLERFYYWLRKQSVYTFGLKFPGDDNLYIASRMAERLFPKYDTYGFLVDFEIRIVCRKELYGPIVKEITISKDYLPDELWILSVNGNYPLEI